MLEFVIFLAVVLIGACIVLPIVAIVHTSRIRQLELRIAGLEAAMLRLVQQKPPAETLAAEAPVPAPELGAPPAPVTPAPAAAPRSAEHLETAIGQKWTGWVAIVLILFAAGFFLK